ncbi:hypothetical protein MRX96_053013 [Rhipicephalus microplus]
MSDRGPAASAWLPFQKYGAVDWSRDAKGSDSSRRELAPLPELLPPPLAPARGKRPRVPGQNAAATTSAHTSKVPYTKNTGDWTECTGKYTTGHAAGSRSDLRRGRSF